MANRFKLVTEAAGVIFTDHAVGERSQGSEAAWKPAVEAWEVRMSA